MQEFVPDKNVLIELANAKMHYGKYKGYYLVNIPEPYFVWYSQKGFPNGKFGDQLRMMYEIKINGLENLIRPLITKRY